MNPASPKKATAIESDAPENLAFANKCMLSMGSGARFSQTVKAASSMNPSAPRASVWVDAQPALGASMIANTMIATAAVESTIPRRSRRGASGSREVGTTHATSAIAASASGTFARNVACHENDSRSAPPTMGPSATAAPVLAPQRPIARARSRRSVKMLLMIDSVVGKMTAAPTPIRARVAVRAVALVVRAASALPKP